MEVYKFGGASVKDAQSVRRVVEIVKNKLTTLHQNDCLIVVISAMGKTTNALEEIVNFSLNNCEENINNSINTLRNYHFSIIDELFPHGHTFLENKIEALLQDIICLCKSENQQRDYDRFYDSLVSYGELISTRIVSYALDRLGVENTYMDMTKLLVTDSTFREAVPDIEQSSSRLRNMVDCHKSQVYVAQGFIGGTFLGEHTTLGREGSDYSAALIANMLNADKVTIWKDVPGILNADPRLVKNTKLIDSLTYSDAVELAYSGAQVIHPKTIRPLENKQIPLYVRPFMQPEQKGSVISNKVIKPIDVPVFIWRKNQVLVTLRAKDFSFVLEDSLNRLFETIYRHRLKVSLIQSSAITVSVCVDRSRYFDAAFRELSEDYSVTYNDNLSLLTIRGTTPEIIAEHTAGKTILLSQTTRRTARFVIRQE